MWLLVLRFWANGVKSNIFNVRDGRKYFHSFSILVSAKADLGFFSTFRLPDLGVIPVFTAGMSGETDDSPSNECLRFPAEVKGF